ncbi:MAG: flagellar export chaperone FliS [Oscillospiraceae bacterium]|nr:flagellar export chaperone FliS [Oscillospiraceae bacterium]
MQYMGRDPRGEYLKQNVMTAGPAGLLAMLYDACVKNIRLAGISYEENKDIGAANNYLLKAQQIISELISCLDMNIGISADLLRIYEFMLQELREANIKKDMARLAPLIPILQSMRDTWQQVDGMQRKNMTVEC